MYHRHLSKQDRKLADEQERKAREAAIPPIEREAAFDRLKDLALRVKKRGRWVFEEKLNYEAYCKELQDKGFDQDLIIAHLKRYTQARASKPIPKGDSPEDRRWIK